MPHVPAGADKEGGQVVPQGQAVDGAVEMDAEEKGVWADTVATLGRVDDVVAQAGDEGAVGRGEDGLLEEARNIFARVFL